MVAEEADLEKAVPNPTVYYRFLVVDPAFPKQLLQLLLRLLLLVAGADAAASAAKMAPHHPWNMVVESKRIPTSCPVDFVSAAVADVGDGVADPVQRVLLHQGRIIPAVEWTEHSQ